MKKDRRGFLKKALASGGLIPALGADGKHTTAKLLTQDGKLVEVDQTVLDRLNSKNATTTQMKAWIDPSKTPDI